MGYEVRTNSHRDGTMTIMAVTQTDFLICDAYSDQYSINWTTRLDSHDFLLKWRGTGIEKSSALLQTVSDGDGPVEYYYYQLLDRAKEGHFSNQSPVFLRLWLEESSVAWQVIPNGHETFSQIVGIGSSVYDPESIVRYLRWSATPELLHGIDGIVQELSELLRYFPENVTSLRRVKFESGD